MARPRIIGLLLALITLVVYLPTGQHDFIVFDDPDYVTGNRTVQAGITANGIGWAFTTFHASNWHPLTWLSHMIDCQLFGLNPGAQHIVSALLHSVSVVLLFVLLLQLTGKLWQAAIVAALFAWHPLRIESVAWVSERKDVLSLFFGLLCLLAYVQHTKKSPVQSPRSGVGLKISREYGLALLSFALGLMSKPMLVTLPFVMLLLDWWPLKRMGDAKISATSLKRLVMEKWPFFLLAAVSCVLTLLAQRGEAVVALEQVPLDLRLKNALVACAGYLGKTFWPANLAIIYPLTKEIAPLQVIAAALAIVMLTFITWHWRRERPHLLVGWLWFIGTLVPVIGIVQVGGQAMADRYTYLPQIGLLIAIVFEVSGWVKNNAARKDVIVVATAAVSVACIAATTRQLSYWKDSVTLFTRTVEVTRDNPVALINLGVALEEQERIPEARIRYEEAVRLDPNRVQAQINLANVMDLAGETEAALDHYRMALQLKTNAPLAHINYGSALVKLGRFDEARDHYETAKRLSPTDPRPLYLMGKSLLRQGRSQAAVHVFTEALKLDPNHLQTLVWLARTKAADNDPLARDGVGAISLAQQAVELTGGNDPFVLDTLAMAFAEAGRFNEAQQTLQRALDLHAQAGDTNSAALTERQRLYQSGQPYRESFTNAVEGGTAVR